MWLYSWVFCSVIFYVSCLHRCFYVCLVCLHETNFIVWLSVVILCDLLLLNGWMTRVWYVDLRVHFSSTDGMHLFDSCHPASGSKMYLIYRRTIKCVWETVAYLNFVKRVHPLLKLNVSLQYVSPLNMGCEHCQFVSYRFFRSSQT